MSLARGARYIIVATITLAIVAYVIWLTSKAQQSSHTEKKTSLKTSLLEALKQYQWVKLSCNGVSVALKKSQVAKFVDEIVSHVHELETNQQGWPEPNCSLEFYGDGRQTKCIGEIRFWRGLRIETLCVILVVGHEEEHGYFEDRKYWDLVANDLLLLLHDVDSVALALTDANSPPTLTRTNLRALGRLGERAKTYIPLIDNFTRDEDEKTSREAQTVKKQLSHDTK